MTDRQQPLIAIDVVPIAYSPVVLDIVIGTAARLFEPFQGEQALPGVLLGDDETLDQAAHRALRDKAGIEDTHVTHLLQLGAFDGPGRDPRDKAISVAFLAVVEPTTATTATWNSWAADRHLPFDHDSIIAAAKDVARTRLWTDRPFTQALTGSTFTTADAAAITETITGARPSPGNFHKALTRIEDLTTTGKSGAGPHGRSMTHWAWE